MRNVPFNIPGGKPPIEVPGLRPKSPVMFVAPVIVTSEPHKTAKLAAAESSTGA
tara:strand:- start:1996 stop:2157 length:162 start_codon:yes stop_codon:yes gene_type:complete